MRRYAPSSDVQVMDFETMSNRIDKNDFASFSRDFLPKDASVTNSDGRNLLHYCCMKGVKDIRIVEILLQHIDPNQTEKRGFTPLHCAVMEGHENIVKILLDNPLVDPNLSAKVLMEGFTPLHFAVSEGHENIAKILLDNPKVNSLSLKKDQNTANQRLKEVEQSMKKNSKVAEERKNKIEGMKTRQRDLENELKKLVIEIEKEEQNHQIWELSKNEENIKISLEKLSKSLEVRVKRLDELNRKPIEELSGREVVELMKLEGVKEKEVEKLNSNGVDGDTLKIIEESDLESFDIGLIGRKKIMFITERRREGRMNDELEKIEEWSVNDVKEWMQKNGMAEEGEKMKEERIDGVVLLRLQARDLIGTIKDLKKRKEVVAKIDQLRNEGKKPNQPMKQPKENNNNNLGQFKEKDMEEALEKMSNVKNGKGSSAHSFLKWIYSEYPPKKDNAALPDGFSPLSSPVDTKSALKKAMLHYHPDHADAHGICWKHFCSEVTKSLNNYYHSFK
eukprot:TRINITY_DN211_c0_g2_i1.p1 TRINITY_DN211_c0_g2~~TRINITY_DN211_c0_g2_i1.p1  ORF type:complete len:506 (-),score=155.72 TRINITY_DN211_c0_g2_i1:96-1613(-)